MAAKVTSRDVARAAGVSQPTVSRVFAQNARVAPDLRDRVMAAAQSLGYRPNRLARAMSQGRSRTIGLVVAYLDNPFYAEAIERFSRAFQARGYHIVLVTAPDEAAHVQPMVQDILAMQIDGLILASVGADPTLTEEIARAGVPLVLFNRGQFDSALPSVTAANFDGGRRAAHLLADAGHRRIAHVSGWQGSKTGHDRMRGFLAGLADRGLTSVGVIDSFYDRARARAATLTLFDALEPPDGLFVGNDHMAFAVLDCLRHDLDLDVPADVSVVGFDDVAMAAWRDFDLTTFRQPADAMVDGAVGMMMHLIAGEALPRTQMEIPADLVTRGTVRARTPA